MNRTISLQGEGRGPSLIELARSGVLGARLVQIARTAAAMHRATVTAPQPSASEANR